MKEARRDEVVQRFTERDYEPRLPLAFHDQAPDPASLDSPEAAMAAVTSAMARGDFDAWLMLWETKSRAYMLEHMARSGLNPAQFLVAWRQSYGGQRFEARRRIDVDGYVIVYAGRVGRGDDAIDAKQPTALAKQADGSWAMTHDLRNNPAFFYDSGAHEATVVDVDP